jgi:hypothetical protein
MLKASLEEIGACCLPFPTENAPVEDCIGLFEELKVVSGVVWQLNNSFVVFTIEGVLNMLHSFGCQELPTLRELAASSDASIIKDIPGEVQKTTGRLVRRATRRQ